MNQFISFINKNKNSQEIKTIRQIIFLHSLWFAVGCIALGLTLDFIYGNTVFQRFGAILVGFAVLHVIENNYLSSKIRYLGLLRANGILASIDLIPKLKNGILPQLNLDASAALIMLGSKMTPVGSSNDVGEKGALEVIKMRDNEGMYISRQKKVSRNEWILAVLGTFIWAFGDWFTNIFYHCPWKLSCI